MTHSLEDILIDLSALCQEDFASLNESDLLSSIRKNPTSGRQEKRIRKAVEALERKASEEEVIAAKKSLQKTILEQAMEALPAPASPDDLEAYNLYGRSLIMNFTLAFGDSVILKPLMQKMKFQNASDYDKASILTGFCNYRCPFAVKAALELGFNPNLERTGKKDALSAIGEQCLDALNVVPPKATDIERQKRYTKERDSFQHIVGTGEVIGMPLPIAKMVIFGINHFKKSRREGFDDAESAVEAFDERQFEIGNRPLISMSEFKREDKQEDVDVDGLKVRPSMAKLFCDAPRMAEILKLYPASEEEKDLISALLYTLYRTDVTQVAVSDRTLGVVPVPPHKSPASHYTQTPETPLKSPGVADADSEAAAAAFPLTSNLGVSFMQGVQLPADHVQPRIVIGGAAQPLKPQQQREQ